MPYIINLIFGIIITNFFSFTHQFSHSGAVQNQHWHKAFICKFHSSPDNIAFPGNSSLTPRGGSLGNGTILKVKNVNVNLAYSAPLMQLTLDLLFAKLDEKVIHITTTCNALLNCQKTRGTPRDTTGTHQCLRPCKPFPLLNFCKYQLVMDLRFGISPWCPTDLR